MTPWETRIRDLVYAANPDECAMTNDSRADNIILSAFVAWDGRTLARDDYVYVVFGEQSTDASPIYRALPTATERAALVPDWAAWVDAVFAGQPAVPPTMLAIQV